ncbi:mucin-6 [Peromyscus eremicus]|uniref:mucin-6 n=1 Tax=Peromyscus eremicus TaxID=42410 RepID=UPI0027DD09A6|nr:mucin-6 [Peromyscus eremicus]
MLRGQQLLLLLFFRGPLINAGAWTGDATDSNTEDNLQSSPEKGWCSTWGAGHFSTFDHHEYDFKGMCNYVFTATCGDASPTFSIQLRRDRDGNISRIIIELGASVVTVNKAIISVRDIGVVRLPYTSNGLQITPYGQSVQLVAKQLELELVVTWGPDAHLMVLVEKKYMSKLCGLCGNFDGKTDNEFLSEDGKLLEPHKYATLQKLDDPNEICAHEAIPSPTTLETKYAHICNQLLTLVSPGCDVPKEPLVLSCQADMAECAQPGRQNCSCATLSEYSRRCNMAGQPVRNWRTPGLCPVSQCPGNQVYQECGEVCVKTCSNPQHSCSSFCTFGCFCPHGTLLDDISKNQSCVPVSQCPCMLNGVVYGPGEITRTACQTCQCTMGRWTCTKQPCPGHCSLEGGSFVTTFDARPYRFHGTCTYTLLQSPLLPNEGTLMAVYDKSGYSHSETSLVSIIYLSKKDKIVISEDEVVTNNGDTKLLPYKTHNITIFRQTSTHLQMVTTFGLELVVQLQPVFQAHITVGPQFRGQTRGLCGNFNGDTTDDFTTSMGIDEGTASLFVDSWRAGNCPAALERETDPCSMSQLNKVCAETHCSMLLRKGSVFEKCHTVVNPQPFYKRCVYQACNYEETFPHICSALGAYAHACSARGILLLDWRSSVDNCTVPCTGNRTFSYDSKACDRTCLSLSDRETECHASAVPVDGCNCPEGTYLNHKAECVHKAQCPCLLDSYKFVQADQSTMINGVICYCINGRLSCPRQAEMFLASCPEPKTLQSCSQSSEDKFGAACAPTCQMLATGIDCVPTKCEPGCICPKGLYENSDGQCVPAEECPCDFAGVSYPGGSELHTDCKNCTCSQGKWTCQLSAQCPSTCVLYGEGHVVTFDGQRFVFDGNCEYTLATDDCAANSSQPTFKVLTENVVCGKSGVTCSRAIKISLGGLSITMADRNYTVSGEEPLVHLQVKPSPLNLVLDIGIPGRLNLTLVWNKHMSVSIKIRRATQDALCGLCGNSNGNMKDDFETRSKYVASSELEFVNSWKENPLCGDASYVVDPCSLNTFRRSWAERKCNIINSQTFAACHSKVYHLPYYEACVRDTCGCDMGGDCECLCDAVAAYAKACLDKGVCVDWRAPDFCPVYCDFYNIHTLVGEEEYQYAQEANCTWHYQPCLCPGSLGSFPDTNIEGCYNCSHNEYFDHKEGTCVPCAPPTTTLPPATTGSQPTTATPTSTEFYSSSSAATPVGPSYLPGLPTPAPSTPSSTEEVTDWTTPKKSTVSSEYPQTTEATAPLTSPLPPTSIPRSTPTRLPVTQATTKPTASSPSSSTKTTAQFTESTTVTPPTSVMPEMSTSRAQQESHHPATTSHATETTELPLSGKTTLTTHQTGQSNSLPPPNTNTWTPNTVSQTKSTHMTWSTHSQPTISFHTTEYSTTAPSETSIQTTTAFPRTQSSLASVNPTLTTSEVTPTSQTLMTPTTSHILPSPSIINPSTTMLQTTTVEETEITQTLAPGTYTTLTSNSFSTQTTSASLTHPSNTTQHQPTSLPLTTTSNGSTMGGTGTPVVHTTSGTTSRPTTPHTTQPPPTVPVSSSTYTTGPPLETSVQTTITFHTQSGPQTSLATTLPVFSTSSVTPTSQIIRTPTSTETVSTASTTKIFSTILPKTTMEGTRPTLTASLSTSKISATSQSQSSFSTTRSYTSVLSHPTSMTAHQSISVPPTAWYQRTAYTCVPEQSCYSHGKFLTVHPSVTLQSGLLRLLSTHRSWSLQLAGRGATDYLPGLRGKRDSNSLPGFLRLLCQLETRCGCCQPLSTYEKRLSLPCPDPNAPGLNYVVKCFNCPFKNIGMLGTGPCREWGMEFANSHKHKHFGTISSAIANPINCSTHEATHF